MEIYEFDALFEPTLRLWLHFRHTKQERHYHALLRLLTVSTFAWFSNGDAKQLAIDYMEPKLSKYGLIDLLPS